MELLLIMYGLYWLITNAAVDLKFAARGQVSPRWRAKLARMEREGQPGYVPRYGSKAWAQDLWGDWLQEKTAARRARGAGPASAEERLERALAPTPHVPAQAIHETPAPIPAPVAPERPPAPSNVVQMFPKKEVSPTMSAEVTGLDPAINHARAVAEVHGSHATAEIESFLAGLAAAGHGDTVISAASHAGIKSQEAADAWNALANTMENVNKATQEAYRNSGGEAAEKSHLLDGL